MTLKRYLIYLSLAARAGPSGMAGLPKTASGDDRVHGPASGDDPLNGMIRVGPARSPDAYCFALGRKILRNVSFLRSDQADPQRGPWTVTRFGC